METRAQGTVLFSGILVLIATLVIVQLWLVTAGLEALLSNHHEVLLPAAIASAVLFAINAFLLRYVVAFDGRLRSRRQRLGRTDEEL